MAIPPTLRRDGAFMATHSMFDVLKKLKDDDGVFFWPEIKQNVFFGYPIFANIQVPDGVVRFLCSDGSARELSLKKIVLDIPANP